MQDIKSRIHLQVIWTIFSAVVMVVLFIGLLGIDNPYSFLTPTFLYYFLFCLVPYGIVTFILWFIL